jgi:hypothetical protein
VTSRGPQDLRIFNKRIIELFAGMALRKAA